jgi:hypothetical protein
MFAQIVQRWHDYKKQVVVIVIVIVVMTRQDILWYMRECVEGVGSKVDQEGFIVCT